jgi:hypothetical protein
MNLEVDHLLLLKELLLSALELILKDFLQVGISNVLHMLMSLDLVTHIQHEVAGIDVANISAV